MLVCTLGDLLLDVIVRLDAPIAPDTDTVRPHRASGRAARRRTSRRGSWRSATAPGSSASARAIRRGA